jgi:hypothetical protein
MSDLGSQLREVCKQLGRLPSKGRLGSSENTQAIRGVVFFCCMLGPLCTYATCLAFGAWLLDLNLRNFICQPLKVPCFRALRHLLRSSTSFMDRPRAPTKILTRWVDNPRPRGCPQINWARTLTKKLLSDDLPTEFFKWRKILAYQNQSA